MTEAHIGSVLPIKNRVLAADEHTAFLAHYDLNEHDVLRGTKAIGEKYAFEFNGGNSIDMGHLPFKSTSAISVEQWVYWNGTNSGITYNQENIIEGQITTAGYFEYAWMPYWAWVGGTSTPITPNTWTNITVTYDGATQRIYKDGVQTYSRAQTGGITNNTNPFRIGARGYASSHSRFYGRIHNTRVWLKALTAEEIQKNMYTNPPTESSKLIGWWPLNEGQGALIRDVSPFHNDATVFGIPLWSGANSVFTLRPEEGEFGGAIAIEGATTNIWGKNFGNSGGGSQKVGDFKVMDMPTYEFSITYNTDGSPFGHSRMPFSVVQGKTYTGSFYLYDPYDNFSHVIFYDHNTGASFHSKTWVEEINSNTKRIYVQGVAPFTGTTTHGMTVYWKNDNGSGSHYWVAGIQIEEKAFATSFVDGSRAKGSLSYPHPLYGLDEGTISFWVRFPNIQSSTSGNEVWLWDYNGTDVTPWLGINSTAYTVTFEDINKDATLLHDSWHMYTIVKRSSTLADFYIDGVKLGSTTSSGVGRYFKSSNKISIGSRENGAHVSNILVDELRMDKVARTEEEILAWYESNSPFWPRGIYRKSY